MSIARSQLIRGPAYLNYNSVNLFSENDFSVKINPEWVKLMTSMFGPVDSWKKSLMVDVSVRLWGAWENLSVIFPSYLMNPFPGTSIFGTTDIPLTVQAYNSDQLIVSNAAITGMSNLYLGVDNGLFAADLKFTGLLSNSTNPESAGAYTTRGTNAYSAATAAFAKTNFKKVRFTAAWTGITGFTSFVAQKGCAIDWAVEADPVPVDGLGTVDMSVKSMIATATCIPIGPTLAQIKSNAQEESQMGVLASSGAADLVWTGNGSSPVVTLKGAYLKSNSPMFSQTELRVGTCIWESTRGFTAGAPSVAASVA